MKKDSKTPPVPLQPSDTNNNALAIISLVLGVISLTGPGLLLGIPAIITGAIALKKKQGERGLSIAGIVTGAVSTFLSLIIIALIAFLVIIGVMYPNEPSDNRRNAPVEYHQQENRTRQT